MEDILRYKKYEPFFGSWYFEDSHREIGSGSFGSVYRIVRHDTNVRPSALKIITIPGKQAELESLRFQGMSEMDIWQYYSQMAEDIKKEYELMSELKGCDNIVSCEDFISFKRKDKLGFDIMIRMELLMPLINYRAETQREIGEGEIVKLGIDICQALEKCQVSHIIHRDIKPENIFISQYGNFKLGDFGIARTMEKTDMLMSRKGTKNYMAPEVFNSQPYDLTADIYSLGIVLYQLLNDNCPPFLDVTTAKSAGAREQAFIHRIKGKELEAPAHGSEMLVDIILKACRFEKGERYQSPQEFREELEKLPVSEIDMGGIDIFEVKGKSGTDATELLQRNDGSTFLLQGEEEGTHLLSKNATDLLRPADGGTGILESDGTQLLSADSVTDRSRKRKIAIGGAAAAVFLVAGTIAGVTMGGGNSGKKGIEASNTVVGVRQGDGDIVQAADGTTNTPVNTGAQAGDVQSESMLSEEQIIGQRKTVTELNGKDLEKLSDLPDYENLEILDLSQMKVKDISILKKLKNLKDLNISYTNVEDISVLQSCEKLTALDISYNNENMTEKKIMTVLASLTGLKELNITGDMVAGDYEEELAKLKNLEILWAGSTGIADGDFLKSLKNLKVLDLDANLSFEDLGKITGLTRLEELNLSATGITNLKGIEKLGNLKICNISLTDITDISVLKNCKNLKEVTVSESPQMKKQVKQLKMKLKNCKFELV